MIPDHVMLEMGKWMWEGGPSPSKPIDKSDFYQQLWTEYKELSELADEHNADYTALDQKYQDQIAQLNERLNIAEAVNTARVNRIFDLELEVQRLRSTLAWASNPYYTS